MIKLLKKICGLIGFKLIDKDLIKNERIISKFSYRNLNEIINKLFSNNLINSLIQIGANDGLRFDILNKYIKEYSPKAILVEPILKNFEDLKLNYHNQNNIFFENSAISVDNEVGFLYKVDEKKIKFYSDHVTGISSFDKTHLIKHGISRFHIKKEKVDSISLIKLIKKYSINNLDLLMIDAEGYDGKIVIDFLSNCSLRPVIIFEYIHIKNKLFEKMINIISLKNYSLFKVDENLVCFPKEKDRLKKML